ncbi:hypothetical protein LPEKDOOE_00003 [Salmonella phage KKP 3953]|nr:hypothetical protein LPEKDOOE_00003 [Salmonella phage KKP 3953]
MRIISKFNDDVYDLQNSLFDPDRVWERKTEELLVKVTDDVEKNIVHNRQVFREGSLSFRGDFEYSVNPLFIAGEVYWLHDCCPAGIQHSVSKRSTSMLYSIKWKKWDYMPVLTY